MRNCNLNGDGAKLSLLKLAEQSPTNALEYAAYTRMGLTVVPNEGKRPLLQDWTNRRLTEEELPSRFGDGQNLGLVNGEASGGLVIIDVDVSEALKIADLFLKKTLRSGREGTPDAHAWYRSPGAKTKKYQDVDGTVLVEVRSDGCQTLVESSVHPNGEHYRWDRNGIPEPVEVDADELEERCRQLATATVVARYMPPVGGRHEFAKAVIGSLMRRLGKEATLKIARAAWHAADADTPDALRDLEGIAKDSERRLSEGGNVYGAPVLEEVVPGLLALLIRWWGWEGDRADSAATGGEGDDENVPTHDELRDGWLERQASPIAFGQGEWRKYGEGFWAPVHDQVVYGEIDTVCEEAKPEGVRPTAGMRSSVEKLARAKAFVPDEVWEANEDILVCQNGTLEISSGNLREHRPEDYALGAVPYEFDPEASASAWHEFLASTVPEAAPFLQEFAGYSLTVDTSLETAVWLHGPPGSGKSTFIESMRAMLGDRAGLLGLADIQRSQFALSQIPGKALLTAAEQPSDYLASTHTLNSLISGEEVTIDKKYKDPYTMIPRAKILWAMNDLPRIKDANSGLFRRVKVVAFPKLRVEPDPALKDRIKAEGAGILSWALQGLRRLKERGDFELPEVVREATESLREANDVVGVFVKEACLVSEDPEDYEVQALWLFTSR